MDQTSNSDTSARRKWTLFIIISVIAFVSVLVNARIFHIVCIKSTRKYRPANILVAHLSAVIIGFTGLLFLNFLQKLNAISISLPGFCNGVRFLLHACYNIISLNIGAIIWVRTKNDAVNLGKSLAFRTIGLMWTIVLFGNLPSLFMAEYVKDPVTQLEKCKRINLFGSLAAMIAYESVRLLVVNVMMCIYLMLVTFKLRSTMKYLQGQLIWTDRTTKMLQQVRFVQRHTIILLLTWFPHGIAAFLYKLFAWLGWTSDSLKYTLPLAFLLYILFILCPLSYVFLLEELSMVKILAPCLRTTDTSNLQLNVGSHRQNDPEAFDLVVNPPIKQKSKVPVKETSVTWSKKTGVQINEIPDNFRLVDVSRYTTVGVTETSKTASVAVPIIISEEVSINMINCSIPALVTPSTNYRLENIAVEVHLEPEVPNNEEETVFTNRNSETLI